MTRSSRKAYQLSREFDTDLLLVEDLIDLVHYEGTRQILKMKPNDLKYSLRVNFLKISRDKAIEHLKHEGIQAKPISLLPEGLEVTRNPNKIGSSLAYLRGEIMPQGLGSMLTVHALDPQPGERILDMAAAPGGKSCFIGERMKGEGVLYSNDLSMKRMRSLVFNLARHGISNVIVTNENALNLQIKDLDRILLDSPCTGAGLLVSKPERRQSRTISDYITMQKIQQNLVQHALNLLKPGGILVYATCSISPMENEEVILPHLSKIKILPLNLTGLSGTIDLDSRFSQAQRFYPHTHGCDGFFIIKMEKRR